MNVNSAAQLGNAPVPVMHACVGENPIHAGDMIDRTQKVLSFTCMYE